MAESTKQTKHTEKQDKHPTPKTSHGNLHRISGGNDEPDYKEVTGGDGEPPDAVGGDGDDADLVP